MVVLVLVEQVGGEEGRGGAWKTNFFSIPATESTPL